MTTDPNQVRINELARELEVKAKAIIDLLPGYGVQEKKTHSSSIPVDVAEKVRKHLHGVADEEAAAEAKAKADKDAKEAEGKAARCGSGSTSSGAAAERACCSAYGSASCGRRSEASRASCSSCARCGCASGCCSD